MGKNLKIAKLGLALALAVLSPAHAETVKVGLSLEPYPPFWAQDGSGNWSGWEIDFKDAVCREAKLDCQIVAMNWDGLIPALQSKKIDLIIASLSITNERKKVIDFSDKYYETPAVILGRKDETVGPTPESLNGKIIGVQVSSNLQRYAQAHFSGTVAEIKAYLGQDGIFQDLAAGRIDAVLYEATAINDFLKSDAGACCENKGVVADDQAILGYGTGIGLRKGEDDLKQRLNAAIKKIRENGTYDAFSKKYFSFDIYGTK